MSELMIAERSAVVARKNAAGRRTRLKIREGKVYRSDDPAVRDFGHLFRPVVEQATAAPGEKRSLGTRRRKDSEATAEPAVAPKAEPKPVEISSSTDDK